jgi:hypothetical protein
MIYKRAANHWKTPSRFERRESEPEEESQPLRENRDAPVLEGHHQGQAQEEGTLEVTYQTGPVPSGPASGAGQARGGKGYST